MRAGCLVRPCMRHIARPPRPRIADDFGMRNHSVKGYIQAGAGLTRFYTISRGGMSTPVSMLWPYLEQSIGIAHSLPGQRKLPWHMVCPCPPAWLTL